MFIIGDCASTSQKVEPVSTLPINPRLSTIVPDVPTILRLCSHRKSGTTRGYLKTLCEPGLTYDNKQDIYHNCHA